jgi:ATP-dependent helicase IRC3
MGWVWRRFASALPLPFSQTRRNYSKAVPVVLRPYQEACLEACTGALASGISRIGVSLPTGSGKTTVFISLLSRIAPPKLNPAAQRSLIIVNSVELARQAANQIQTLFPTWSVEIEQGTKHHASGLADVYVLVVLSRYCPGLTQNFLSQRNPAPWRHTRHFFGPTELPNSMPKH